MNTAWSSLLFAFVLLLSAHAQTTEKEWQKKAMAEYPDLAIKDSAFNKRFLELLAQRRKDTPAFFEAPKWPMTLADELAASEPKLVEKLPPLILREYRVPASMFKERGRTADGKTTSDGQEVTAGCRFRPGRFAMYSPVSGTLVIKDTPENLETVRKLIARHTR